MSITISTIIPAYNCEKTLARALDSVLAQTCLPDEIIIVNDGSTDGTADVIADYVQRFTNIISVNQENAGSATARNNGVKLATSDWVSFLDADDYWYPRHLKDLAMVIEANPGLSWATTAYENERLGRQPRIFTQAVLPYYLAVANHKNNPLNTDTVLIRRSIFWECGGFREGWHKAEDLWLWFQLGLRYPAIGYCSTISSVYNHCPTSITSKDFCYHEQLKLFVRVADQIIQEVEAGKHAEREDVKVYISRWVANILYLSLFHSKREYRRMRSKYYSFFLPKTLPIRTRLYTIVATCGLSVFRFHRAATHLYHYLHKFKFKFKKISLGYKASGSVLFSKR